MPASPLPTLDALRKALLEDERFADYTAESARGYIVVKRGNRQVAIAPEAGFEDLDLEAFRLPSTGRLAVVLVSAAEDEEVAAEGGTPRAFGFHPIICHVQLPCTARTFAKELHIAFDAVAMLERVHESETAAFRSQYELSELLEIAASLSTERELQALLETILTKSRFIAGADAGSLYTVEYEEEEDSLAGDEAVTAGRSQRGGLRGGPRRHLRFALTQNDSVPVRFESFTLPLDHNSIAGYVAETVRPLNIPDVAAMSTGLPFSFSRKFDEQSGYVSVSMLTVPMQNREGEVLGVIQLLNKKREPRRKLTKQNTLQEVIPFDERSVDILTSLASQAAIALENARLLDLQKQLFAGFVDASVLAIEQRDPSTRGHSRRVSKLCVGLAEVVDGITEGPYAGMKFTRDHIKELEYAGLLHDFGKVGVREEVLVKAKKLYPWRKELLDARFRYIRKQVENELLDRKVRFLLEATRDEALARFSDWDREAEARLEAIDDYLLVIAKANEPRVLAGGDYDKLATIAELTYIDEDGTARPYLNEDEVLNLRIARGSLNEEERSEIENHVSHTVAFLSRIPWTPEFRNVARIAGAHHEKLTGRGYPYGLGANEIPVQSRIMTVSDIFDALTARDRPYKPAVPLDRALDILGYEVKDGNIDGELVRIFTAAKIFEKVMLY